MLATPRTSITEFRSHSLAPPSHLTLSTSQPNSNPTTEFRNHSLSPYPFHETAAEGGGILAEGAGTAATRGGGGGGGTTLRGGGRVGGEVQVAGTAATRSPSASASSTPRGTATARPAAGERKGGDRSCSHGERGRGDCGCCSLPGVVWHHVPLFAFTVPYSLYGCRRAASCGHGGGGLGGGALPLLPKG